MRSHWTKRLMRASKLTEELRITLPQVGTATHTESGADANCSYDFSQGQRAS